MDRSSIAVPHVGCKPWVLHLLPAPGPNARSRHTIEHSSIDWVFASATSGFVHRSSKLVGRTGVTEALVLREARRSILPWWWCAMLIDLCLCCSGRGRERFAARTLAEFQGLDRDIALVALRCCRRTSIALVVVERVVDPMHGSPGGHRTWLNSCSS